MPSETHQELNRTKDHTVSVECAQCSRATSHLVLVSADRFGSTGDANHSVDWWHNYQIVQCKGCEAITFRESRGNSWETDVDDDGNTYHPSDVTLYPPRLAGRRGIQDDAHDMPPTLRAVYEETRKALVNEAPVLAGIGLRVIVETICRGKRAKGHNLLQRIDDLVAQQVLPLQGAKILHAVRNLGNDAAHEAKPHTAQQLALAMEVVENLIRDVYLHPARAKRTFQKPRVRRKKTP